MPVTDGKLTQCIGRLGLLTHFPIQNKFAIEEAARILDETCASDEEATKAVDSLLANYNAWPGPMALRNALPRKAEYFKAEW